MPSGHLEHFLPLAYLLLQFRDIKLIKGTLHCQPSPQSSVSLSASQADPVDEETSSFVAAVILKHILQLVCNASAIYEVGPTPSAGDSESSSEAVASTSQGRVASCKNHNERDSSSRICRLCRHFFQGRLSRLCKSYIIW